MEKFIRRGIALVCTIMMITNPLLVYAEEAVQQEKQQEENIQDIENEKDASQEENSENIYKEEQDKTTEVENEHKELEVLPEEENTETEQEVVLQEDVSKIYGRQVININKGWGFTSNDNTTVGWSFPKGGASGTIDLPHCWEYVHPTQSYIPQRNMKTVTYTKTVDISEMKNRNLFLKFYIFQHFYQSLINYYFNLSANSNCSFVKLKSCPLFLIKLCNTSIVFASFIVFSIGAICCNCFSNFLYSFSIFAKS